MPREEDSSFRKEENRKGRGGNGRETQAQGGFHQIIAQPLWNKALNPLKHRLRDRAGGRFPTLKTDMPNNSRTTLFLTIENCFPTSSSALQSFLLITKPLNESEGSRRSPGSPRHGPTAPGRVPPGTARVIPAGAFLLSAIQLQRR